MEVVGRENLCLASSHTQLINLATAKLSEKAKTINKQITGLIGLMIDKEKCISLSVSPDTAMASDIHARLLSRLQAAN